MISKKIDAFEKSFSSRSIKRAGLVDGFAGVSLLYLEAYHKTKNEGYYSKALGYLKLSLAKESASKVRTPFLFGGSLGITWVLKRALEVHNSPALESQFNKRFSLHSGLAQYLDQEGRYELMSGAVGVGVLAKSLGDEELLGEVLNYLERFLVKDELYDGHSFYRSLEDTSEIWNPDAQTTNRINTGLSHGISGVLLFLNGLEDPRAISIQDALAQTLIYINQNKETKSLPSYFPASEGPKQNSWCYGDMGVGLALAAYGVKRENSLALETGKEIFLRGRTLFQKQKQKSLCLCHGVSVVKLMLINFNRLTNSDLTLSAEEEALLNTEFNDFAFINGDAGRLLAQCSSLDSVTGWEGLLLLRGF
ncbi:MAG: hypothetical protein CME64_17090 [Halobacteriovoraceae bacterium]|nr:hypothetical protein [Halobacteriovoraceae bacterium]